MKNQLDSLIGLEFKRNVYGLSLWTDKVTESWVRWRILDEDNKHQIPEIMIKGTTVHSFPVSDVIFIRELSKGQQLSKQIEENRLKIVEMLLKSH